MQKIKSFGETLKELKDMCNMKSITLANYLGYDISYISKWCANKNLPSGRNVTHILTEISRIFSREIFNSNMIDLFNNKFGTKIVYIEELQQYIRMILDDSYDRSKRIEKNLKKNSNKTIFGNEELDSFIMNRIFEILSSDKKELNLYCTLDILDILDSEIILQKIEHLKNDSVINLKIVCDKERFINECLEDIYNIHYVLSKLENINVQVYSDENLKKANILLVKDEFAIIYSLDEEVKSNFGAVIANAEELEKIYASLSYRFKPFNIIIDMVNNEELKDKHIFNFYNSKSFKFLFDLDFDFLDPKSMMDNLNIDENLETISSQIANLETIVERKLKNSHVDIFIERNTLNNYIYNGIILSNNENVLNILDRIETLSEYMKDNKEIKIHMLKKINIYEVFQDSLSVYLGENFLLMKKTKKNNGNNERTLYYIIKNEDVLRHLDKAFEEIKDEQYSKEILREELIDFLQGYRNLLKKN